MCAIDLRSGKVTRNFKGFSGSVRRLEYHPEHPLLVSVGIDRYLRVHDTQKGKLLHRVYLKQRLASMVLCSEERRRQRDDNRDGNDSDDMDVSGSAAEEDGDDVWKLLESREREGKKKRRAYDRSDSDSDDDAPKKKKNKKNKKKKKEKMQLADGSSSDNSKSMFPLHPSNFDVASRTQFRQELLEGKPYGCAVISPLCDPAHMVEVHSEVKHNLKATFKETDLFKLYQTDSDLATMETSDPATAAKMPKVLELRDALYSDEFRSFVADITGVTDLTSRVDCSINAYGRGCHLMCHDDVIGTRRVSYIIYFAEPEPAWKAEDGGQLELYPLDAARFSKKKKKKKKRKRITSVKVEARWLMNKAFQL